MTRAGITGRKIVVSRSEDDDDGGGGKVEGGIAPMIPNWTLLRRTDERTKRLLRYVQLRDNVVVLSQFQLY